ncbi:MAG: hypothetical protein H6513_15645 [Acidimicrobiaceae bacterium]|nr:hypothetical protein [Actinomycetota bacterium]MCB9382117.1 hypothetical protein [Acidimicrobiaceae bacterium]
MATTSEPVCRLCGIRLRDGDDVARIDDDLFHAPCAEPAFGDSPEWRHVEVGVLNGLATGAGIAVVAHL